MAGEALRINAAEAAVKASATPGGSVVRLLGVDYTHVATRNGGDLYATRHGLPLMPLLQPENWLEKRWFERHRERLKGTSTVYRLPTRKVNGRSIELVIKWSRVGQDVPLQTKVLEEVLNAQFNSPFEEFALVEELREGADGPRRPRLMTHRPLAIYVPPERLQLWQTGRSKYKIKLKLREHPGVEIDILRQYILIYEYIGGVDAAEAYEQLRLPDADLAALTAEATEALRRRGFLVADMKPAHLIVRKRNDGTLLSRGGRTVYALVDFELLQRTPEYEATNQAKRRAEYLIRQRDRFAVPATQAIPENLRHVNILGVDYIYGRVESTGGALWIVGHDPLLFDFFQPERWRRPQAVKLSNTHHVYYTRTKDNINLVWKTSRIGERPDAEAGMEDRAGAVAHGYNSPFEEFAYAIELAGGGLPTTYPRAIYRTGPRVGSMDAVADRRRLETHRGLLTPDGRPLLQADRDYIKIWGYWNGPAAWMMDGDADFCRGVDAQRAMREGLLDGAQGRSLVEKEQARLAALGFEALNLSLHHLLLCELAQGGFMKGDDGLPELWLCNFELVRKFQ
jgi:hypothetical protein